MYYYRVYYGKFYLKIFISAIDIYVQEDADIYVQEDAIGADCIVARIYIDIRTYLDIITTVIFTINISEHEYL